MPLTYLWVNQTVSGQLLDNNNTKRKKHIDILWKILKLQHKYPDGSKFWFGNRLIYLLEKPEHIEKILGSTKQVAKEKLYKYIVDEVGEGLLMSSGSCLLTISEKKFDSFLFNS